ncbi:phosphate signaling complex protein PhoU [Halorientalis sp.]|uniref:phosphate signaling complex protein PhoU n=1 Tax=Halorientalis sp. TaxID=1931229 RepID=UPI0026335974|nr:phosphate signaling complex protein PhoU [Halorientalis sp.]
MPRDEFQRELDALRDEVVRLGDVVSTRLRKAITALDGHDVSTAARIADADSEINERYLDLEQDCIDLFALQQPVAGDLRFVAASFKILTDLERIADLAANLAAYVVSAESEMFPDLGIADLGTTAVSMLDDALAAYDDGDATRCRAIADSDDDLDGRCERVAQQVIRRLVDRDPDADELESLLSEVTRILLTVRDVERIGDHAVNIAARTLYMIENDDVLIY